jgi:hypothetical protein
MTDVRFHKESRLVITVGVGRSNHRLVLQNRGRLWWQLFVSDILLGYCWRESLSQVDLLPLETTTRAMPFRTTIAGGFSMESIHVTTSLLLVVATGTMVTGKVPNMGRNWPDVDQQHVSNSLLVDMLTRRKSVYQRHRSLKSGVFSSFIRMLPNFALESTR